MSDAPESPAPEKNIEGIALQRAASHEVVLLPNGLPAPDCFQPSTGEVKLPESHFAGVTTVQPRSHVIGMDKFDVNIAPGERRAFTKEGMALATPMAVNRLLKLLADPNVKDSIILDAVKWVIEKETGKAKQEIDMQSSTLSQFMELAQQIRAGQRALRDPAQPETLEGVAVEFKDVAPTPEVDPIEQWVNENI